MLLKCALFQFRRRTNPEMLINLNKDDERDFGEHPPLVVVDGNCWLYECSYYLARGLALGHDYHKGFNLFMKRFMQRVDWVTKRGFQIQIVFDGRRLQAKHTTDADRREIRAKNKKIAAELERSGQGDTDAAHEAYSKSFAVTNELIHKVYKKLQSKGVPVVIAPHEGDAQCAWYALFGHADIVITRDSDLIVHGCKCIFFWNKKYVASSKLGGGKIYWRPYLDRKLSEGVDWSYTAGNWDRFIETCVLAGCDYCKGVKGVGLQTAMKLMRKYGTMAEVVKQIRQYPAHHRGLTVPEDFDTTSRRAVNLFKHALVFNPDTNSIQHCRNPPQGVTLLAPHVSFVGITLNPGINTHLPTTGRF